MDTTHDMQHTLLLDLDEVATQLRWTRRSVERQIQLRRLRAAHLGRSVRVERTELDWFVASMRGSPRATPAETAHSKWKDKDGR